jgi:IclR family transcriptional regulator, blcABC operon repressor
MPLADLARGISAAKSSISNLCQVLEDGQMIARTPAGYLLGVRTVQLGRCVRSALQPGSRVLRHCTASPFLSHELVQVAMLDGTDVLLLARHESRAPMRLSASIGSRLPAAPTAVGNASLTTLTDIEIAARFTGPQHFPRRTDHSVQTFDGLLSNVWVARDRGYAIDDNEVHPGVYGVVVVLPPWRVEIRRWRWGPPSCRRRRATTSSTRSPQSCVGRPSSCPNPLVRRPIDGVPQDA